jgi:hypothetical protein
VELELPGSEAIIDPARKKGLAALLDEWDQLDEGLTDIEDPPLPPENVF